MATVWGLELDEDDAMVVPGAATQAETIYSDSEYEYSIESNMTTIVVNPVDVAEVRRRLRTLASTQGRFASVGSSVSLDWHSFFCWPKGGRVGGRQDDARSSTCGD
jgi:hypothetical protein